MNDGDRVTGDILKKDGETLTVKSKNFGEVTLKWADVATLKTDQPLNVVLPGGRAFKGTVETRDGRIFVTDQGAPQGILPSDVVAVRNEAEQRAYERLLRPGLLDLWTITGSLNLAGIKGNAESSTLTTPITFVRASNTTRTAAYFNSIRSTATVADVSAKTAQAVRGGWAYDRNLTTRVFFNGFNDYEYDRFQALDLRVVLGGGLGYQVWNGETARFLVVGGGRGIARSSVPPLPPCRLRGTRPRHTGATTSTTA
jgi:hypothetical protein